nr:MAG TPA: hypothetical protein [Caudoviricetes sp.]
MWRNRCAFYLTIHRPQRILKLIFKNIHRRFFEEGGVAERGKSFSYPPLVPFILFLFN